jgi:hypothetical protein
MRPTRRTRGTVVVSLMISFLMPAGCRDETSKREQPASMPQSQESQSGADPGLPRTRDEYIRLLPQADSEEAKWELTKKIYEQGVMQELAAGEFDKPEAQVFAMVVGCMPRSDIWLEHYPLIVKQLDLTVKDLLAMGSNLDRSERFIWEELVEDGRVYHRSKLTYAETARAWVNIMTGVEFLSGAEFTRWFTKHKDSLVWDKSAGRFVLQKPPAAGT